MKYSTEDIAVFWFRRDLRLEDNSALSAALDGGLPVLPVFIFDEEILKEFGSDDRRLGFIYERLEAMHQKLHKLGSGLYCVRGNVMEIWARLLGEYHVKAVYINKDYEPDAIWRDDAVAAFLRNKSIKFIACKDQVIFEELEITKADGMPYTVFTPYMNKWRESFKKEVTKAKKINEKQFLDIKIDFPMAEKLRIRLRGREVRDYSLSALDSYAENRDFPAKDAGTYLGPHLRFGTVSIREIFRQLDPRKHAVFMSELIWREFFMQIMANYPRVVHQNFREKYDGIEWRNNEKDFASWCRGETGYPLVDAGMRELNESGYMHNRVRMLTASFLCKHLLTDWRWGERYFAGKLLDYELSSNNGNWQWAAGTGCDAAPYFRIFNPVSQQKKFDKDLRYIKKWVPELGTFPYSEPMVDHNHARKRALDAYKKALNN